MKVAELLGKIVTDDLSGISLGGSPANDTQYVTIRCKGIGRLADAEVTDIWMSAFRLIIDAEMPERGKFIKEGNEKGT